MGSKAAYHHGLRAIGSLHPPVTWDLRTHFILSSYCPGNFWKSTPSTLVVELVLMSLAILMGGRCASAEVTGEETWGVATINDREVGARFF